MKKLTISIVAYNDYEDVREAIDSIEHYTNIPKQIYIIDNSCREKVDSDRTKFQWAIAKYKDVEYVDLKRNIGFGAGHNYVLSLLDSQYHAIVNPDVILKEDVFTKLIEYMDTHLDCGMCIPKIVDEQGKIQDAYRNELTVFDMLIRYFFRPFFKKRIEKQSLKDMDYTHDFQVPFAQGCFLLIRTNLYKKLNGFDDRFFMYMEDADLSKRVNEVDSVMYVPDCSVIHKWSQGSHKSLKLFKIHVQSMISYFNKWGWKWK